MSEPKFTPGPWSIEADPYHFMTLSTVVAGEIGKEGFNRMVVQVGGWNEWKEQEANAHLIAAAPDLYKALAHLEPYLDAIVCYASTIEEHPPNGFILETKAALAKARGEG